LATYGDEESGILPEEPYTRLDAEYALNNAKMVLSLVELLKETEPRT
jgi:HEPN domain-containing protein